MVRNAVHNAFLNTLTLGTAFLRVPARNEPFPGKDERQREGRNKGRRGTMKGMERDCIAVIKISSESPSFDDWCFSAETFPKFHSARHDTHALSCRDVRVAPC